MMPNMHCEKGWNEGVTLLKDLVAGGLGDDLDSVLLMTRMINPRRACAARVTVLGLSVCLSVCLSTLILALQATRLPMSYRNGFRSTRA